MPKESSAPMTFTQTSKTHTASWLPVETLAAVNPMAIQQATDIAMYVVISLVALFTPQIDFQ